MIAFSASQNNDKVGLLLYTEEVEHYIPPKKGRRHILRVIRDILFFEPSGKKTSHKYALDYLNRVQRRRSVVFLISDFLDNDSPLPTQDTPLFKTLFLTHQRHDLVSIALSDPREHLLPKVGLIALEDAETSEIVEINTGSHHVRERYAKLAEERREAFQTGMRKKGLDWIDARTDQPYLPALRKLFALRARRH